MSRRRSVLAAVLVSVLGLGLLTGYASAAPQDTAQATVTAQNWIDDRTVDLTIDSPALGTTAPVRLLLPAGWAEQPDRTWPQLWLLHGCCEPEDYRSWDTFTDVEAFTADLPVIVVLPSDGAAGMYTQWWDYGLGTTPDWETFHTSELSTIVDRDFRGSPQRAVAGVSTGGYGAIEYAASHPGLFGAAASYSGLPNTLFPGIPEVIKLILARTGTLDYLRIWGSPVAQYSIWTANNPFDRVENLRGMPLYFSNGDGSLGPLDASGTGDLIEGTTLRSQRSFTDRLTERGIPFTADYYGAGTHSWPYWERALHRSWPVLAPALGL